MTHSDRADLRNAFFGPIGFAYLWSEHGLTGVLLALAFVQVVIWIVERVVQRVKA